MDKEIKSARKSIRTHLKAREFDKALPVCQEIISKGVRSAELYNLQGMCFYGLENPANAMESYKEALELDPGCLDALKGLCRCLFNADENQVSHQVKLSWFTKLCSIDPDYKFCGQYRKEICLSHWKVADYESSFDTFKCLTPVNANEVLQFMFSEVNKTNSFLCFQQLHDMLEDNEDLLPTDGKMRFYYEYGSYLNDQGKDPSSLVEKMVSNLDHYKQSLIRDSSGGSVGSEETGIPITPASAEWWPSKTLSAQLWMLWYQIKNWNGAPKLQIPENILFSLGDTAVILRKDQCPAKTILHLLEDFDCDKYKDVVELCDDYQFNSSIYNRYKNTGQFNVAKSFLRDVASATIRKNVEKLPNSIELLEGILRENPTFQNQSLLKLVVRFRCYVSYTFNIPTNLDYINEGAVQDPILSAWLALIENTTDILTCEYPHPMLDAVKQYIAGARGRHVNIEKLLSIWESHYKNFTYSTLILKVLKTQVEEGKFDVTKFEEKVNQCYCNDQRNPTVLSYLGDIYKTQHKDYYEAARHYEKSIKFGGGIEVLKLIDSLPQTEDGVKELIIKSHNHILVKTPKDPKLHIRMAMLHWDDPEATITIKHLLQALKISKEPLTLELLGEKYLSLGKFRSAYKTFVQAFEMEPTSYRQYSVGSILLQLGYPNEALAEFKRLLEDNSSYGPGILGCVKSLYQIAVNSVLKEARYPHATELANQCVQYLDQLLIFEPRWSSTWKYLGDICLLILRLRDSSLTLTDRIQAALTVEETEFSGQNLAHLAVKSYNRGLELEPNCSEYLLDLTRSYLELAEYQEEYLLHALILSKRAVQLRPQDYIAWNILGAVCIKQKVYNLAQHACIKSLKIDKDSNPVAWTNLGLLYMLNKDYELANQCYSEAQSNDPKYAQCWVAMAYLARAMGYEEEAGKIFKDLIQDRERRSTVEGTLEYAVKFCQGDMSREMVHEVFTLTTRCSHLKHSADWLLFNISGVMSEQLHLNKIALQNYVKAQTLSPSPEVRAEVQQNIERVQCKLGNYSAMNQNKHNLWLALGHMRRGQYGMASSILDSIGEGNETSVSQADVEVFQAVLCWLSKDTQSISGYLENPNSHIGQLIKCLMMSEEPPQDLRNSVNGDNISSDIQTKFACVSLKLFDETLSENLSFVGVSELLSKANAIPIVSADSQYLFAKYLVIRKIELARARAILDRLISSGDLKEDIFELYVEILVHADDSTDDNPADAPADALADAVDTVNDAAEGNADVGADEKEAENIQTNVLKKRDDMIRSYSLRSYRMFPWRQNSKTLFQRYSNSLHE